MSNTFLALYLKSRTILNHWEQIQGYKARNLHNPNGERFKHRSCCAGVPRSQLRIAHHQGGHHTVGAGGQRRNQEGGAGPSFLWRQDGFVWEEEPGWCMDEILLGKNALLSKVITFYLPEKTSFLSQRNMHQGIFLE